MKLVKMFLNKSLSVFRLGKAWFNRLISSLFEAGRTISYVETVNPVQSDSLHKDIKQCDPAALKRAYEQCVRISLKLLRNHRVKLAIDVTEDPYWGKEGSFNTRAKVHELSDESWQYVNLSVVEPHFIPLMSLPYRQVDSLDELVMDLLEYAKTLPISIDLVLFDRGFYHAKLIDYLENCRGKHPLPYLIFVPKNKAIVNYLAQTSGSLGIFRHEMVHCKDKTEWHPKTTIVICKGIGKNKIGEPIDWCFATNQRPSISLVREYRKRWNIETGFRIHDEAKIKTKSSNPMIRYFYHLLGMLMILSWRLRNRFVKYIVFKRFLRIIEYAFRAELSKPPPAACH